MEIVERVRLLCKEKGIAISKMEKDLGYGNGYFNPKKLRAIPSSRLKDRYNETFDRIKILQ